jgi:isoamylase
MSAGGLRHNPHKLLLEPHARGVRGNYTCGQAVFGHDLNDPEKMDEPD